MLQNPQIKAIVSLHKRLVRKYQNVIPVFVCLREDFEINASVVFIGRTAAAKHESIYVFKLRKYDSLVIRYQGWI